MGIKTLEKQLDEQLENDLKELKEKLRKENIEEWARVCHRVIKNATLTQYEFYTSKIERLLLKEKDLEVLKTKTNHDLKKLKKQISFEKSWLKKVEKHKKINLAK